MRVILVVVLLLISVEAKKSALFWPGTKWCGPGRTARKLDDLGESVEADLCCREHDHCPDTLVTGESRYGLSNNGRMTLSHCDCDEQLHRCLKDAGTRVADAVGFVFFAVMQPACYRQEHPEVCRDFDLINWRCVSKGRDQSFPKTWRWFPSRRW